MPSHASKRQQFPEGTEGWPIESEGGRSMTNDLDSMASANSNGALNGAGWLRLGLIAAGSALIGGLAAAWWYRKTLSALQQAAEEVPPYRTNIPGDDNPEDA